MIVFFSNNRATSSYFSHLQALLDAAFIYRDKLISGFSVSAFFDAPQDAISRAVEYRNREAQIIRRESLKPMEKLILTFKARWFYAKDISLLKKKSPALVVVWNGLMFRRSMFVAAAEVLKIPCCFMENGLLPNTTVCDFQGINAVNSMPREARFYKALEISGRARQPVDLVVREAKETKKSSGKALPERFIFIPFQVDSDSQIVIFSNWIKNMHQLFELMIGSGAGDMGYKLVFKEHPSSPIDYSYLHNQLPESVGIFANEYNTQELIEKAEAVVTINSTVGIEALLFAKKVILLGEAFYNIAGLVMEAQNEKTLSQAIAGIDDFDIDDDLRLKFLHYLEHNYLVQGTWRKPTTDHCRLVVDRMLTFLAGRES